MKEASCCQLWAETQPRYTHEQPQHSQTLGVLESKEQTDSGSEMLTAGHKLTSSVDPKRDTAVRLRQVRSFEAVFVLKAAVRRFFGRRGTCGNVGDAAVKY